MLFLSRTWLSQPTFSKDNSVTAISCQLYQRWLSKDSESRVFSLLWRWINMEYTWREFSTTDNIRKLLLMITSLLTRMGRSSLLNLQEMYKYGWWFSKKYGQNCTAHTQISLEAYLTRSSMPLALLQFISKAYLLTQPNKSFSGKRCLSTIKTGLYWHVEPRAMLALKNTALWKDMHILL